MALHCVTATTVGLALILVLSTWVTFATADSDKDIAECTEQLAGMATCLPYVQGEARAPTPDCCGGLKQVLKNNSKCLCVIVEDRNDPDLGLNINVTLALGLPAVCHAPANVSRCPALLNLPPNSPDAQVFYQFANSLNHSASSRSPSPTGSSTQQGKSSNGGGPSIQHKSVLVWMLEVLLLWVSLWRFAYSTSLI